MKAAIATLLLVAAVCAFVAISGIRQISSGQGDPAITYFTVSARLVAALAGIVALSAAYACFKRHPWAMRHIQDRVFQPIGITRRHDLKDQALASFKRRAFAFGIDFMFVVLLVALASLRKVVGEGSADQNSDLHLDPFHGWALLSFPLYFGLGTYLGKGRTLGKRLMRMRVVSLAHDHLTLWHSIERSLGYGASMLEGGFGFLQYFIHPNCQTVHDRIAETIVVSEPKTSRSPEPKPAPEPEPTVSTTPAGSESPQP